MVIHVLIIETSNFVGFTMYLLKIHVFIKNGETQKIIRFYY